MPLNPHLTWTLAVDGSIYEDIVTPQSFLFGLFHRLYRSILHAHLTTSLYHFTVQSPYFSDSRPVTHTHRQHALHYCSPSPYAVRLCSCCCHPGTECQRELHRSPCRLWQVDFLRWQRARRHLLILHLHSACRSLRHRILRPGLEQCRQLWWLR
jgi:hypothetical protein